MPTPTGCILFVSDNASLLPHAYSRIADLIVSGNKNYIVGVALATIKGISLNGLLSQPSATALKQLKERTASIISDFDLSVPAFESTAALANAALQFAAHLPLFDNANKKELIIMTNNPNQDSMQAAEYVSQLRQRQIQGYAICTGGASIEGVQVPPWLKLNELDPPPLKIVSPVKTYDGLFTIGDPESPLIAISVLCYPATRRASSLTPSTFHGEHVAVSSYQMQTSEGPPNRPEDVQKGFTYLSEMVTANTEVQKLMDGEFNGAEHWPRAFELLATVPEVPPWIPLGGSDVVIGKDNASSAFIAALHTTLKDRHMHAIARLSKGARGGHYKGSVELSLLQPFENDLLLRTALPYKEEFKSFYRFPNISQQPSSEEEGIDALTDELVLSMRADIPEPPRNTAISRIGEFIKGSLVYDSTMVPSSRAPLMFPERPEVKRLSAELASQIGITEQVQAPAAATAAAEPSQEVSYQATQTEINIDDLL